jgi:transposase
MGLRLSMDLRSRVVAAYERGEGGYETVAQLFGIGSATLRRLVRRKRNTGSLEPAPAPHGFPPRISGPRLRSLALLVDKHPDATAAELTDMLNERISISVSRSAVVRAIKRLGLTLKKSPSRPARKRRRT